MSFTELVKGLMNATTAAERPPKCVKETLFFALTLTRTSWMDVFSEPWTGLNILDINTLIDRGILPKDSASKIINRRRIALLGKYVDDPKLFFSGLMHYGAAITERASADILGGDDIDGADLASWPLHLVVPVGKAMAFIFGMIGRFGLIIEEAYERDCPTGHVINCWKLKIPSTRHHIVLMEARIAILRSAVASLPLTCQQTLLETTKYSIPWSHVFAKKEGWPLIPEAENLRDQFATMGQKEAWRWGLGGTKWEVLLYGLEASLFVPLEDGQIDALLE
jgi:hypothetical protein